ncbi:MAG: hypothetical protein K2H32_06010 [Muribaculaceae bacterium]|nr:hypothetical protein [Muribaculaceae bacterium]MDE5857890.1 hypothetical protein [Muribaculaceae bacterium]MDE7368966.1 hypothetical protein [Muribaculaceae bacterium]
MTSHPDFADITEPQLVETARRRRTFSIGLPRCDSKTEKRFPLTPEGVNMLVERGFTVKMESEAATSIHYPDSAYIRKGASIVDRQETLLCDIVIHLAPLKVSEIKKLRRGAMLLTLLHIHEQKPEIIKALIERGIITIAIDLITDDNGNRPFADILEEIDGRASVAIASSLLADSANGKGILLGGIAGIIPCEVVIIGSGIGAIAAARSATGLGAIVHLFDNDVYSLRTAIRELGPGVIGSALHPNVLNKALASADIVLVSPTSNEVVFGTEVVQTMKKGVLTFDLTCREGGTFPSLPTVDLSSARPDDNRGDGRVCYIHAGSAVPRTAAMALSNTFITMLDDIMTLEGVTNALKLSPGLQAATITFMGKLVNGHVAREVGMHHVDISLFIQLS